jgi:hypothetical protein
MSSGHELDTIQDLHNMVEERDRWIRQRDEQIIHLKADLDAGVAQRLRDQLDEQIRYSDQQIRDLKEAVSRKDFLLSRAYTLLAKAERVLDQAADWMERMEAEIARLKRLSSDNPNGE